MRSISRRQIMGLITCFAALAIEPVRAYNDHNDDAATPGTTPTISANTGTGAIYLTITNNGDSPDRLVSATTEAAQAVQIHSMSMDGGVMKMEELADGLEIPASESVTLDPNNLHLMLLNLNHDLTPESAFVVELTFEVAGPVNVTAKVTISAPEDDSIIVVGDLQVTDIWSRPAPRLTPVATPAG